MSSVVDLIEPDHLGHLATPANLRLGRDLAGQGRVEIIEIDACRVTARVGAAPRRKVELNSTPHGLEWRCTCGTAPDLFCKHCVAVAITAWAEAPPMEHPH